MADKYGYSYSLLPPNSTRGKKTANVFNHTLKRFEEFKTGKTVTGNSVNMAVQRGMEQANYVVINILTLNTEKSSQKDER